MKSRTITVLITIISSIILFVLALFTYGNFVDLTLPKIENVKYTSTGPSQALSHSLYFVLALALIPVVTIFVWRMTAILTIKKKLLTICILLAFMMLFIEIRREMIKSQAQKINHSSSSAFEYLLPLSSINFELFAISGLLTGGLVSFFAMRQKKTITTKD